MIIMALDIEYSHSDLTQAISDFLSLTILIINIFGKNSDLCKKSHLTYYEDQINAKPFFKTIINQINTYNSTTIKILNLKYTSKIDEKTNMIKRLYISNKIHNFFIFTKNVFPYTLFAESLLNKLSLISNSCLNYNTLDEFKLDYLTLFNKAYIDYFKENSSYFLFAQQLVLSFQNNVDFILSGCDPEKILYYYSNLKLLNNSKIPFNNAINL